MTPLSAFAPISTGLVLPSACTLCVFTAKLWHSVVYSLLRRSSVSANGRTVRVAGCVIFRQRPGTANGFLFLSLEDETGIANAIVEPEMFDTNHEVLVTAPYLLIEDTQQN